MIFYYFRCPGPAGAKAEGSDISIRSRVDEGVVYLYAAAMLPLWYHLGIKFHPACCPSATEKRGVSGCALNLDKTEASPTPREGMRRRSSLVV